MKTAVTSRPGPVHLADVKALTALPRFSCLPEATSQAAFGPTIHLLPDERDGLEVDAVVHDPGRAEARERVPARWETPLDLGGPELDEPSRPVVKDEQGVAGGRLRRDDHLVRRNARLAREQRDERLVLDRVDPAQAES